MKALRFALSTACAAILATGAVAAPATSWTVDPANSKLGFKGAMNGDAFTGQFRRWTAQIAFDPKNLAGSKVSVSVDMASAVTGDKDRDEALPTPDWFSAKVQPKASFVSTGFKDLGGGRFEAAGNLTIRGVSRPIALPFTLALSGDTARMNGSAVLNRTTFGIGQGQWKTGEVVATEVTVTVSVTAHKAH